MRTVTVFAPIETGDFTAEQVRKTSMSAAVRVDDGSGDGPRVGKVLNAESLDEVLDILTANVARKRRRESHEVILTLDLADAIGEVVKEVNFRLTPSGVLLSGDNVRVERSRGGASRS